MIPQAALPQGVYTFLWMARFEGKIKKIEVMPNKLGNFAFENKKKEKIRKKLC